MKLREKEQPCMEDNLCAVIARRMLLLLGQDELVAPI